MSDSIRSKMLRHMIYVQRYSGSVVRDVMRLLNAADRDLMERVQQRLMRLEDRGIATTSRLNFLLAEIRGLSAQTYQAFGRSLTARLQTFAEYETQFQTGLVSNVLPMGANFTMPPASLVARAAVEDPLRGKLLSEWVEELSRAKYVRIRDALRLGIVEGQTTQQIARRIRGTRSSGFTDGLIETDRRGAEALVRTAVNDVATKAKNAVFEENDDIVESVQWVATLDDRTCELCGPLDGEEFELSEGPRPPRHVNCRCTIVPVLRPEFDLLPTGGTRASRGDEGPEQVRASVTFEGWLRSQSAAFQDDTLGSTRGALFRRGDLSLDHFTNRAGDLLTLDELRRREPAAFGQAGLGGP